MTPTDRFNAMKPLVSYLPLKLNNGCQVDTMDIACSKCGSNAPTYLSRGEVTKTPFGYDIKNITLCTKCQAFAYGKATILECPKEDSNGTGFIMIGPSPGQATELPWPEDIKDLPNAGKPPHGAT